jgi:putative transposase
MGVDQSPKGRGDFEMKKTQHSATQIVGMLREAEALLAGGRTVPEECRHLKIAESTYYRWRSEYGGMKVDQAKPLKRVVADQALDLSILKEVARGNY